MLDVSSNVSNLNPHTFLWYWCSKCLLAKHLVQWSRWKAKCGVVIQPRSSRSCSSPVQPCSTCVPAQFCDESGTGLHCVRLQLPGSQIVSSHWQVPQAGNRPPTPPWPNEAGNIISCLHFYMTWNQTEALSGHSFLACVQCRPLSSTSKSLLCAVCFLSLQTRTLALFVVYVII